MILRSLKLENIRSYVNENIVFPEGSLLLSGDIGSGKSTILLAIEFALFGIMRSGLTGAALLRHGSSKGSVELKFEIDKIPYVIKRALKRTKTSIGQDSGYILMEGRKLEATPVELKAKIIEILGYPEELITRSKSLIYRFTVYTAQEQMKEILFEDRDVRLDTLRKVFGIDKYKSIRENAVLFVRELKKTISEQKVRLENYDELMKEKQEKQSKYKETATSIAARKKELDEIKGILEKEKEKLKKYEGDIKKYNELRKDLEVSRTITISKNNRIGELKDKIEETGSKINKLERKLEDYKDVAEIKEEKQLEESISELREKVSEIAKQKFSVKEKAEIFDNQIKELESEIKELSSGSKESILIRARISDIGENLSKRPAQKDMLEELHEKDKKAHLKLQEYDIKIKDSESIIEQIEKADSCPTCKKPLDENHRKEVIGREKDSIKLNKREKEKIAGIITKISSNIEKIQNNLGKLSGLEKEQSELKEQLVKLDSFSGQMVKKQKELGKLYEKRKEISGKEFEDESRLRRRMELEEQKLSKVRDNNLKYREKKNVLALIGQEEKSFASLEQEVKEMERQLQESIAKEKALQQELKKYSKLSQVYEEQKLKLDEARELQKQEEIGLASLAQEMEFLKETIRDIDKKLSDIEKIKEKIKELSEIREWFENFFLSLMSTMEKHIMVSIHREFNSLVKEWFSILIDDIDVDLDEEFTVRITQDGYETSIEGLSGGEKTSVALAYRLALNRVINDLIPRINTKDLIILDEPTDGFSTEQLDKVRDVLRALDMRQTIIVSHEPKMESYVDSIIRVNKINNMSKIMG